MNKDKNGMILSSKKNLKSDISSPLNNETKNTLNKSLNNNDNILGTISPVELEDTIDINTISLFANENQIQEIFPDFRDGDTMHFEILDKTYLNENQNVPENNENGDSLGNDKDNNINLPSSNSDNNNTDIQTLPHYKEINLMLFTNKDIPRDHLLISPELQCLLSLQPFDLLK